MNQRTIAERADHLSRRRARMLPMLAVFYLIQQTTYSGSSRGKYAT